MTVIEVLICPDVGPSLLGKIEEIDSKNINQVVKTL
jgi:hypothetical protein